MFVAFLPYTIIIIIITIVEKVDVTDTPPVAVKQPNHGLLDDDNTSSGKRVMKFCFMVINLFCTLYRTQRETQRFS